MNGVPTQPLVEVGVTVYSTVAAVELTLLIFPATSPVPTSPTCTPVTVPVISVTCQEKVLVTEFPVFKFT